MTDLLRGDRALLARLLPAVRRAAAEGRRLAEWVELDGRRAYLKGGPLRGRTRLRHGLRRLAGLGLPRTREHANLDWLRDHGFDAPRPLASGAFLSAGLPTYQFLATEEVAGARPLRELLEAADDPDRTPALDALAALLGRLHAAGFTHRDPYPRNLLVEAGEPVRIHLLDAWRGGPRPGLRGPAYDLACFFLDGARLLAAAEQRRLVDRYLAERASRGAPADRRMILRAAARARRRLRPRRGQPAPGDWEPPW